MAAKLRDDCVIDSDAHIVDAGSSAARDFARGRDQFVAELARLDEGDVAVGCDRTLVVRIAGEGERRIREQEDEAAMGNALAVDHVRLNRHRQRRLAAPDVDDLHAEARLASSSFHIASAQARARSSADNVALTFTYLLLSFSD